MTTLLCRQDLARMLLVKLRTIDRLRRAGSLPDPLPGPGRPRWLAIEIAGWLVAGRPNATAWRKLRKRG
jgi:hypothetical protein